MKIYSSTVAPNPRRVRIFLAEKGIQVPYKDVDIGKAVNRQPEYRQKINPMGEVPVLELDDGTHIAESVAICRYFEEVHPQPPLFGVGALERATVEMWNRRMEYHLLLLVAQTFRNTSEFFKGRIPQVPEFAEVTRAAAVKSYTWLDGELANRRFIAGDKFTIADITALCAVDFGRVSKIRIQPEQENLARWREEVSARPSAKA
ncbi:MAG TPA: glutathione S-transferase family protein [Candidatus Binataceae bacterium]